MNIKVTFTVTQQLYNASTFKGIFLFNTSIFI